MTILHISDSHLFADAEQTLLGVNTRESFEAVLDNVTRQGVEPDLIVMTGDISQDYSAKSYQYFAERISQLNKPVFSLAGNHDELSFLKQYLCHDNLFLNKQVITEHWQVLLLNTHSKGQVYGVVTADELTWLETCLQDNPELPTVVFMHHHPIPIDSLWLDKIGVKNAQSVTDILQAYPQVKLCGFGHVHQTIDVQVDNIRYLSVPSTCVQFLPQSDEFSASEERPGYRVYHCNRDGHIEVETHRVSDYSPTVNLAISGY
ncbi:MAG: 3',5'-cyclic-AMP phosphodiesterase [Kangiellaceae bacterium]|nr:3',5'-cyclic-AMP phosphodiesterase [Kangiellaceae bacterium]